jgi:alpha-1,2-mannosyltransferase
MRALIETLRSGAFVSRERTRLVAILLLLAFAAALAWLFATAQGLNDAQGRPLGTDFSNVYTAGRYVLAGEPEAPFDPARQYAGEQAIFGDATPFYGWHYPPFFLFIAGALAFLPYLPALLAWQGATLALYLLALRAVFRDQLPAPAADSAAPAHAEGVSGRRDRLWVLLALAFPAVFVNFGHGHNGLLTAALMGGALATLDRRPVIAGILFGLLVYKPQFGILIPPVLLASGRWTALAAATATVAALIVATTLAFGPSTWEAFFASTQFTRTVVLEAGSTGWHKIQSVFALVRMWGGPVPLAYAVQALTTIALAAALIWLWRAKVDFAIKAAALVIAAVLATPYSLDYDMTALAPAIAYLGAYGVRAGFAPYEKTTLAALWLSPLFARSVAAMTLLPLGVAAMVCVLALALRRAAFARKPSATWRASQYPAG